MKHYQPTLAVDSSMAHKFLIEHHGEIEVAIGFIGSGLGTGYIVHGRCGLPETYPYIAVIKADHDWKIVDVMCVTLGDFEVPEEPKHLQEVLKSLYNKETMRPWLNRIEEVILKGEEKSITFDDLDGAANPDNQYCVNDHQIQFIRDQGYTVEWHKHPRSYEVSGW